MPAESKGIGQYGTHGALLGLVEGKIQIIVDLFIPVVFGMIDCRRHYAVLDNQNAGNGLDGSGSAQQVSSHRLGGTDVQLVGMSSGFMPASFSALRITNLAPKPSG